MSLEANTCTDELAECRNGKVSIEKQHIHITSMHNRKPCVHEHKANPRTHPRSWSSSWYLGVPRATPGNPGVPRGTRWYLGVPWGTPAFLGIPRGTSGRDDRDSQPHSTNGAGGAAVQVADVRPRQPLEDRVHALRERQGRRKRRQIDLRDVLAPAETLSHDAPLRRLYVVGGFEARLEVIGTP
jgi:hypothetical protein